MLKEDFIKILEEISETNFPIVFYDIKNDEYLEPRLLLDEFGDTIIITHEIDDEGNAINAKVEYESYSRKNDNE